MEKKTIVDEILAIIQNYDLTFSEASDILMAVVSKLKNMKIKF